MIYIADSNLHNQHTSIVLIDVFRCIHYNMCVKII